MVFYIRREDVPQCSRFDMKGVVIICLCFGGGFFVECWNFSPDAMTWVLRERHEFRKHFLSCLCEKYHIFQFPRSSNQFELLIA